MGDLSENFSRSEFACKCGCGADHIDGSLVSRLQSIRDLMREPIYINSGVRCPEYNRKVGGSESSEHIDGQAVDVKCILSPYRYEFLTWAIRKFKRIGIGPDFIHIGVNPKKDQEVAWTYYEG